MSAKIKNQSEVKEKNAKKMKDTNTTINNEIDRTTIDVCCLMNLYQEMTKANLSLKQILEQLFIDHSKMVDIKKNLGSRPNIWTLQDAKDSLEIIIANAALENPQTLEYKDWLVEVKCKKL